MLHRCQVPAALGKGVILGFLRTFCVTGIVVVSEVVALLLKDMAGRALIAARVFAFVALAIIDDAVFAIDLPAAFLIGLRPLGQLQLFL